MPYTNPWVNNHASGSTAQGLLPPSTQTQSAVNVVSAPPAPANTLGTISFNRAAKKFSRLGPVASGLSIAAAGAQFAGGLPAYGYWKSALFQINATGGTSAGVAAFYEDAPWSAVSNLTITDRSGAPLTSLDGYSWFLTQLYGGYYVFPVNGDTNVFAVQTTTGAGCGNFKFDLPYTLEFGQGAKGVLPNDNASAAYQFTLTLASGVASASGPIYTTAPTTLPTVATNCTLIARYKPTESDPATGAPQLQTPPGFGAFQTWSIQTVPLVAGLNTIPITRVGNVWRTLLLIFRSATNNTRATAETDGTVPTNFTLLWDAATLRNQLTVDARLEAFTMTGIICPAGVIPILWTFDGDGAQGYELGNEYIPTALGANMQLQFTNNGPASGKLTILLNDIVVPAGVNLYDMPEIASSHPLVQAG